MPIAIVKQKEKEAKALEAAKTEVKVKSVEEMSDEELADHYGTLEDQCNAALASPIFNQFDITKKELLKRVAANVEPQDGAEITGEKWALEIGACKQTPRKIADMAAVAAFLGQDTFYKIAKVGLGDLDKHLTPTQLEQVIDPTVNYGSARTIVAKYLGNKG